MGQFYHSLCSKNLGDEGRGSISNGWAPVPLLYSPVCTITAWVDIRNGAYTRLRCKNVRCGACACRRLRGGAFLVLTRAKVSRARWARGSRHPRWPCIPVLAARSRLTRGALGPSCTRKSGRALGTIVASGTRGTLLFIHVINLEDTKRNAEHFTRRKTGHKTPCVARQPVGPAWYCSVDPAVKHLSEASFLIGSLYV